MQHGNFLKAFCLEAFLVSTAVWLPFAAAAADQALVQGSGVVVTAADVLAQTDRLPEEIRPKILSAPEKVEQIAINLYVRRVLAARAKAAGIQNQPQTAAALNVTADQILSDAFLAKAVADVPPVSDAVLETLARNAYAAGDGPFVTAEQRRVRHILIGKGKASAKARAEEVLDKLGKGADFSALAAEYSDDESSRQKGGDLGFFARGRMVKPFEDAVFALAKPGDLGGPVETEFGSHVLRLEEIRPAGKRPYNEVVADIKRELRAKMIDNQKAEILLSIRGEGMQVDPAAIGAFARQPR